MPRILLSLLLLIAGCTTHPPLTNRVRAREPPVYTEAEVRAVAALVAWRAYHSGYEQAVMDCNCIVGE